MNRGILFKAKRKNWRNLPKEEWWVEGYYIPHIVGGKIVHHYILNGEASLEETKDDDLVLDFYTEEIAPDTLCQYTGLTDKNGNKIWENDIVSDERTFTLAAIKWSDDDYAGWHLYDNFIGEQQVTYGFWGECKVIGNIFDNPELLIEE